MIVGCLCASRREPVRSKPVYVNRRGEPAHPAAKPGLAALLANAWRRRAGRPLSNMILSMTNERPVRRRYPQLGVYQNANVAERGNGRGGRASNLNFPFRLSINFYRIFYRQLSGVTKRSIRGREERRAV